MNSKIQAIITATGSYIPEKIILNAAFLNHHFYEKNGEILKRGNTDIVSKFKNITGIEERRYVDDVYTASDLGYFSARDALDSSKINPETLDYIIVAHNFGDVYPKSTQGNVIPTLAARIKYKLGIKNPDCVAYDLTFGCPGWLQGMIQANYFIQSGDAKRILVIGTETLSRVADPHDRDSMIYSDGAGATILEAKMNTDRGILSHKTQSHTANEAYYLYCGKSNKIKTEAAHSFIKMDGRKVYEYALMKMPLLIKQALEKSKVNIHDIQKVLIHQANEKMDQAILKCFFKLYDLTEIPEKIMPMSIAKLGNSSVATIPTLLDLILKNKLKDHQIQSDDVIIFGSIGAGMNINAMVYRF